jgi:hypothetical protein
MAAGGLCDLKACRIAVASSRSVARSCLSRGGIGYATEAVLAGLCWPATTVPDEIVAAYAIGK